MKPFDPKAVVAELNYRSPNAPNEVKQLATALKMLQVDNAPTLDNFLKALKGGKCEKS